MIVDKPEIKTIILKGLNMKHHMDSLDTLRKKGWIAVSTKPDTKNMQMIYRLRLVNALEPLSKHGKEASIC
jgi:hypothetical protein